jgi:hypothetical protein
VLVVVVTSLDIHKFNSIHFIRSGEAQISADETRRDQARRDGSRTSWFVFVMVFFYLVIFYFIFFMRPDLRIRQCYFYIFSHWCVFYEIGFGLMKRDKIREKKHELVILNLKILNV